jgi:Flp pilus assembly protein TadD
MPTPDELYEEAVALRDQGDRGAAVEKLKQAVEADPTFTLGHGMLAKLCADLAMADEAIYHAQKVVELAPDDTFSYTALSVIYQRCGKIPEAEEAKARAYYKQMGIE